MAGTFLCKAKAWLDAGLVGSMTGKGWASPRRADRAGRVPGGCGKESPRAGLVPPSIVPSLPFRQWGSPARRGPTGLPVSAASYTHRVAISNHRILAVNEAHVTFRWKDYAHHSRQRTMTLTCEEFLRRFLQHVCEGFPRIRYLGWLANRRRSELLLCYRVLLAQMPQAGPAAPASEPAVWQCPRC